MLFPVDSNLSKRQISSPLFIAALVMFIILAGACNDEPAPSDAAMDVQPTSEPIAGESLASEADSTVVRIFGELMHTAQAESWAAEPLGKVMSHVGEWFGGNPYVAGTLDQPAYEQLVIKLDGFDCVTFVESVLALSRTIKAESYSLPAFVAHLESQRYRDGVLDGYCSRLHYFSDWIINNEARGHVRNITKEIGGEPLDKQLNFMSTHRESYPHLADDSLFAGIQDMEVQLKDVQLYYIPQGRISTVYPDLEAGDIIALATDIEGLDVSHTGLVYKNEDGTAGLLHASTANGVIVSPDLQAYVENNRRQIGIVVTRPLDMLTAE